MIDQDLRHPERICLVLSQNGYHEAGRNKKYIVMVKDRTNGRPNPQTSTILVPNADEIAPDLISIISHKSGLSPDQLE